MIRFQVQLRIAPQNPKPHDRIKRALFSEILKRNFRQLAV